MSDLAVELAAYRAALADLATIDTPALRVLRGDCPSGARLAVVAGSFNPPTRAHVGLARAALATGEFNRVAFLIAVRTIDKEQVTGAPLEERYAILSRLIEHEPRFVAVACNRGLYLDQARAARAACAPRDLAFIVGYDKITQILDPRYYAERDSALRSLFSLARFYVAPRDGAGAAELAALFQQVENMPFADRVRFLPLSELEEAEQHLSSTQVRELLARGADVSWAVPEEVAMYFHQSNPYAHAD